MKRDKVQDFIEMSNTLQPHILIGDMNARLGNLTMVIG